MVFTNAHCPAPECNPSRTAVLTGVAPHRSGVYTNAQPFGDAMPDAVTLPQHFRRHGYATLGAGKVFHNGIPDPDSWDAHFPRPTERREPLILPANHIEGVGGRART